MSGASTRQLIRDALYAIIPPSVPRNVPPPGLFDPNLARLASSFERYAKTSPTAYETGASHSTGSGSGVNLLERQAERALSQVLGRGPGRSANSFMAALNDTFPTGPGGQVLFTPSRSAVSMVSANGYGTGTGAWQPQSQARQAIAGGLVGQLSVEQAALYREATVVAADALGVLKGLTPFAPVSDAGAVEMLRSVVGAEIQSLVEEFGRIDLPRRDRVETYFDQMLGPAPARNDGHMARLGLKANLDGSWKPTSESDEAQMANFVLLQNYGRALLDMWNNYQASPTGTGSFSLQMQEASRMLSVVAESNSNFMAALDSVGFDENERRGIGTTLDKLSVPVIPLPPGVPLLTLPQDTLYDMTSWFDELTNVDGQRVLSDSGLYGLRFVTRQADRLFLLLATILIALRFPPGNRGLVAQVLTHERVAWALDDLFLQVKSLADQEV